MTNCQACQQQVNRSKNDSIQCSSCKKIFHLACEKMTTNELAFIKVKEWKCGPCDREWKRPDSPLKPPGGRLEQEVAEICVSLESLHAKFDEKFKSLEDNLMKALADVQHLTTANSQLTRENQVLRDRVQRVEQELLLTTNSIEIHGLPVKANEDVVQLVADIGRALDVPIKPEDVNLARRIPMRAEGAAASSAAVPIHRPPPIMVHLVRRATRDSLLSRRKVVRDFTTRRLGWQDNEAPTVYINEALSQNNKKLYALANNLRKSNRIKFLWVREGRVYIRKKEGQMAILLKSHEQLENFQ